MAINYAVWGAPETWIDSPYSGGSSGTTEEQYKYSAPKCADFGTPTNPTQLRNGIASGRIIENEPIDLTICPCGHDETVSAFGKLAIFNEDKTISLTPRVVERNTPVNWCFSDLITDTLKVPESFSIFHDYTYSSTRGMRFDQWSPNAVNTDGYNNNYYLSPYTFYYTRSILLSIEVQCITGETETAITTTWRTLDDWKTNHNTENICGVRCFNRAVNYYSSDTLSYINSSLSQYRYSGKAVILDPIPNINNNGELTDTCFYSFLSASDRGRYTYLFKDIGDITTNRFAIMPAWDMFDSQTINKCGNNSLGYTYYYKIPYSNNNYETILKMVSCFGCYFTPTNKTSFNYAMTDTDLYLPIVDDEGITHGEYTRGTGNIDNDLYSLDSIRDKDYDPSKPVDPNRYSDTTNWNNVDFTQAFTKRYLLTGSQVASLASELWAAQSSKPADIDYHNFAIDEYLTNNPIDTIVSLKYFPCTFADVAPAIVHLGKYTTNIAATALGTSVRIIDFAPIECFPHFGDFRDYEPHTELAMYIPFCGTVKIPTAECMGNYVSVKLAIDTSTGAATGYVIVSKTGTGGICVATCQGMAAIDIPVSGLQSANLANAVFNATANWTQTQVNNISANSGLFKHMGGAFGAIARGMSNSIGISDVKGGILGGPIGAAGTLVNSLNPISALQKGMNIDIDNAKADYELSHIQVPTRLVGSASPILGCVIELDCRLIIYRPVTDETALSNYADTVGFATLQGGTVSQFSGLTVGTIDVSGINATAKEKQAIAAAFANGVYL